MSDDFTNYADLDTPAVVAVPALSDEERIDREKKEAQELQQKQWAVAHQIEGALARFDLVLSMLLDDPDADRAVESALLRKLRKEWAQVRALVPQHRQLGGSQYSFNFNLLRDLYRD